MEKKVVSIFRGKLVKMIQNSDGKYDNYSTLYDNYSTKLDKFYYIVVMN